MYDTYMVKQNCDRGTQGTPRASEPRLRKTGESRVDGMQTKEELVHGQPTLEEPVEGKAEPEQSGSWRGNSKGRPQVIGWIGDREREPG